MVAPLVLVCTLLLLLRVDAAPIVAVPPTQIHIGLTGDPSQRTVGWVTMNATDNAKVSVFVCVRGSHSIYTVLSATHPPPPTNNTTGCIRRECHCA